MIDSFAGSYRYLSNFYPARVEFEDAAYPTVENAYQAAKTTDPLLRESFRVLPPGEAKRLGRTLELRPDWEDVKLMVMRDLLVQKFSVEPYRTWLLETGNEELVEGNYWGETFWGVCKGSGENHLGKLLMGIREELRGA